MHHHFAFLYTMHGILQCKLMYHAEVLDTLCLDFKQIEDPHNLEIHITQIPQGKTNHGLRLYGRCLRSKKVTECGYGAYAMYMAYRLELTGEFKDLSATDWCNSKCWFDIKLLVDATRDSDRTKSMQNNTYGTAMRKTLAALGIASNHYVHIGRVIGPKLLELLEVDSDDIRKLGNWNPSIQEQFYSTKLPLGPMRQAAGYTTANGMYYCARTMAEPSLELMKQTPFGFAFDVYDEIKAMVEEMKEEDHVPITALATLRLFKSCARIFLQDCACMQVENPTRSGHPMFRNIRVFQTDKYRVSSISCLFLIILILFVLTTVAVACSCL